MSDPIPIGCAPLDALLDGGIERATVTQVYGPPAAGKTNIALSATAETATHGGSVVYIDTEGLSMERFDQVITPRAERADVAATTVADRVIIKEVYDFEQQQTAVKDVESFAETVDLVVLDSATGFYRLQQNKETTNGEALRSVANQITHLLSLARREQLAVLVTNQVYTDPDSDRTRPLGGHTLDHWTGTIIRLDRFRGGNRRATLEKHRSQEAGATKTFQIVEDGLVAED